ncbi:hypothetical protein A2U01_0113894, partial [Trifolium medium]|nr:hypothetical protein [Trifolium medium]
KGLLLDAGGDEEVDRGGGGRVKGRKNRGRIK